MSNSGPKWYDSTQLDFSELDSDFQIKIGNLAASTSDFIAKYITKNEKNALKTDLQDATGATENYCSDVVETIFKYFTLQYNKENENNNEDDNNNEEPVIPLPVNLSSQSSSPSSNQNNTLLLPSQLQQISPIVNQSKNEIIQLLNTQLDGIKANFSLQINKTKDELHGEIAHLKEEFSSMSSVVRQLADSFNQLRQYVDDATRSRATASTSTTSSSSPTSSPSSSASASTSVGVGAVGGGFTAVQPTPTLTPTQTNLQPPLQTSLQPQSQLQKQVLQTQPSQAQTQLDILQQQLQKLQEQQRERALAQQKEQQQLQQQQLQITQQLQQLQQTQILPLTQTQSQLITTPPQNQLGLSTAPPLTLTNTTSALPYGGYVSQPAQLPTTIAPSVGLGLGQTIPGTGSALPLTSSPSSAYPHPYPYAPSPYDPAFSGFPLSASFSMASPSSSASSASFSSPSSSSSSSAPPSASAPASTSSTLPPSTPLNVSYYPATPPVGLPPAYSTLQTQPPQQLPQPSLAVQRVVVPTEMRTSLTTRYTDVVKVNGYTVTWLKNKDARVFLDYIALDQVVSVSWRIDRLNLDGIVRIGFMLDCQLEENALREIGIDVRSDGMITCKKVCEKCNAFRTGDVVRIEVDLSNRVAYFFINNRLFPFRITSIPPVCRFYLSGIGQGTCLSLLNLVVIPHLSLDPQCKAPWMTDLDARKK